MEFKKFNYINASKKFRNHFHCICLYYRHTHYRISQRQHVFRVYVIHSNCARLHRGVGIKMSWVEQNRKINNWWGRGDDYSGLESFEARNSYYRKVVSFFSQESI